MKNQNEEAKCFATIKVIVYWQSIGLSDQKQSSVAGVEKNMYEPTRCI